MERYVVYGADSVVPFMQLNLLGLIESDPSAHSSLIRFSSSTISVKQSALQAQCSWIDNFYLTHF